MVMDKEKSYPLILHLVVFIWGFTGILAGLIPLDAEVIVMLRMLIAVVSLLAFFTIARTTIKVPLKRGLSYLATGCVIMLHWYFFFQAVKISTISVAVVCLATSSFFTALLEPLFFKRKVRSFEVIMAVFILIGVALIFGFESTHVIGILFGLLAAFLAALFTVVNGIFIKTGRARVISFWEMLGGAIVALIYILLMGVDLPLLELSSLSWFYILVLGVFCTAIAFLVSVEIMKVLSPFTVNLSVNMEPVYTIILSLLIFGETELMQPGFYAGTLVILSAVLFNAVLKARAKRKNKMRVGITR